jgi:YegS/Rv2252/BmrU family lipid kinase
LPAKTLVIVNGFSRAGATGRRWRGIENKLRLAFPGEVEFEHTRCPRDAERIGREAVRSGAERLIVAGGDGTTSEVVTGLLDADLAEYAQVGLLPLGSGGDLRRTLALPDEIDDAIEGLRRGATRRIDAGRVSYYGRDGKERTSYFLNVASLGISGLVDELVNRTSKVFGGPASFAVGALRAMVRYRCAEVVLRVDDDVVHEGALVLAAAANGRYFGGGMHIGPGAKPDDGALYVVVVGYMSKPRLIANFPSIYRGTHLDHPAVSVHRGRRIDADGVPGEVWLDIDGEPLGTLPATIELLPSAITLFGVDA